MSRQIKFRVWCEISRKYTYNWEAVIAGHQQAMVDLEAKIPPIMEDPLLIFEQFTGQIDKNGVEIYEGDIVKKHDEYDEVYEIKWCVAACQDVLAFHPIDRKGDHENHYYGEWRGDYFKIVGNINENPELMR